MERSELDEKYERVDRDEARRWWEAEYARTPATEPRRFCILSGAIFPMKKGTGSEPNPLPMGEDALLRGSCPLFHTGIHNVMIARATLVDGRALAA